MLKTAGITGFIREHPIPNELLGRRKSHSIFLDFYFPDLRLDLEIDGSQHQTDPIRQTEDVERDHLLRTKANIRVLRFPWRNGAMAHSQLQEFQNLVRAGNVEIPTSCTPNTRSSSELRPV